MAVHTKHPGTYQGCEWSLLKRPLAAGQYSGAASMLELCSYGLPAGTLRKLDILCRQWQF